MDPGTVPLINEDELDCFDSSMTVTYKLDHAADTQQRIAHLENFLRLNAHPRNEHNIRVALHA